MSAVSPMSSSSCSATTLTYTKLTRDRERGFVMAYQLKDQDTTPPDPDEVEQRSVAADGIAALVMAAGALGLIVLILSQVID